MGLYFRAEFWLARIGVGLCGGRTEGDEGAMERSRGSGEVIAVPYGEKFWGVRGSGERRICGFVVRMGAAMLEDVRLSRRAVLSRIG